MAALLALGRDGTHPAGAVVGVLVDGRLATAAGGVAVAATGAEPARPMTPDTRLDLASVTKVASTTALAMRLVTDGLLHLEFPVTHYLPSFGSSGPGVPGAGASGSARPRHRAPPVGAHLGTSTVGSALLPDNGP